MSKTKDILERAKQQKRLSGPPPKRESGRPAPVDQARLKSLAARMGRGRELRKPVAWPGGEGTVALRVLSVAERDAADAAAIQAVGRSYGDDDRVTVRDLADAIARARAAHYLALAIEEPDEPGVPVFSDPEELAAFATEDELTALFNEYADHKSDVDPELVEFNEEEIAIIDQAIKKKDATSLRDIASGLPRSSLLSLVDRLASSLSGSSTSTPS